MTLGESLTIARAASAATIALLFVGCASTPKQPVADSAPAAVASDHLLGFLFGEWRGEARVATREGGEIILTQTERVGPILDGNAVVIEGKGYDAEGKAIFNAFAVVSSTGAGGAWEMRSYADARAGTFPFEPKPDGFVWSTPAGPNARTVYTAVIVGDRWRQTGEFVANGQPPRKVFEMDLRRIGDTDWPAAGAVAPSE